MRRKFVDKDVTWGLVIIHFVVSFMPFCVTLFTLCHCYWLSSRWFCNVVVLNTQWILDWTIVWLVFKTLIPFWSVPTNIWSWHFEWEFTGHIYFNFIFVVQINILIKLWGKSILTTHWLLWNSPIVRKDYILIYVI